uniref:Uncharacterized protein n=1 Tax=Salarias fasciatus TaxID=181472 RepID=A0A672F9H6_SALFA
MLNEYNFRNGAGGLVWLFCVKNVPLLVLCVLIRPGPGEHETPQPIKTEGLPHHFGHIGTAVVEVCSKSCQSTFKQIRL